MENPLAEITQEMKSISERLENLRGIQTQMEGEVTSLTNRLDSIQSEFSDFKGSINLSLNNLLPKVDDLLMNRALSVSNSSSRTTSSGSTAEFPTSLFEAAENGDVEAILRQLTDGVDFRLRNEQGDSVLHVAAKAGHERALIVILGVFRVVDIRGFQGRTALHCASAQGHVAVVRRLILTGAQVDAIDSNGDFAVLLAFNAGHADLVELLANHNASLDAVDRSGNSVMVAAAKAKQWDIVQFLLQRGASSEEYKGNDNAPLYLLVKEKNYSLVTLMLKQLKKKEKEMRKALLNCNDAKVVYVFEDIVPGFCRSAQGREAMIILAIRGEIDIIGTMLDLGANIDGMDSKGGSCLMNAAFNDKVNVMKMLLNRGAFVDLATKTYKMTALHYAAQNGHLESVRTLLEAGASVKILSTDLKYPIDLAKTDEIRKLLRSYSQF